MALAVEDGEDEVPGYQELLDEETARWTGPIERRPPDPGQHISNTCIFDPEGLVARHGEVCLVTEYAERNGHNTTLWDSSARPCRERYLGLYLWGAGAGKRQVVYTSDFAGYDLCATRFGGGSWRPFWASHGARHRENKLLVVKQALALAKCLHPRLAEGRIVDLPWRADGGSDMFDTIGYSTRRPYQFSRVLATVRLAGGVYIRAGAQALPPALPPLSAVPLLPLKTESSDVPVWKRLKQSDSATGGGLQPLRLTNGPAANMYASASLQDAVAAQTSIETAGLDAAAELIAATGLAAKVEGPHIPLESGTPVSEAFLDDASGSGAQEVPAYREVKPFRPVWDRPFCWDPPAGPPAPVGGRDQWLLPVGFPPPLPLFHWSPPAPPPFPPCRAKGFPSCSRGKRWESLGA